jgi:hypothetical protein
MNLCNENHDEVCFENRECPVCAKMKEIESLEENISELLDEVKTLEQQANP